MSRVVFFVDGFNVYHAIEANPAYRKYKWLDLEKLCRSLTRRADQLVSILYFTAYTPWDVHKAACHRLYVQALQVKGIEVVFGEFKRKDRVCRSCHRTYQTFEEKQTDVNIAIKLFQLSINDVYDTAIILSGDSDLLPAINAVKRTFPAKRIGVAIPPGRQADALKHATDFHIKLKERHLSTCQFPDVVSVGDGRVLERPPSWR
jgi:uncharacterized LabA/DUF88 family protein